MPLRTIIIKATRSGTASTVIIRRGASGIGGGDHGALDGLGDDDHTQYLNNARGDARYAKLTGATFTGPITTNGATLWSGTGGSITANGIEDSDPIFAVGTITLRGAEGKIQANEGEFGYINVGDLNVGEDLDVTGNATAANFIGSGSGLTGTAAGLTAGTASSISNAAVLAALPSTTPLPITSGGTNASSAGAAATNLGLGTGNSPTFAGLAVTDAVQFGVISTTAQPVRIPLVYSNASDFTTASTAFQNATGLSFPVLANKNYGITAWLITNKTDANGMQIQFTGPASPIKTLMRIFASTGSFTSVTQGDYPTAFSVATTTFNTVAGDGYVTITGGLVANGNNAGTVQLQLKAITGGTAKIYAGSWIQVTQLN